MAIFSGPNEQTGATTDNPSCSFVELFDWNNRFNTFIDRDTEISGESLGFYNSVPIYSGLVDRIW